MIVQLRHAADRVGSAPPSPATVRGSLGRVALRGITWLLRWYTSQVRLFQQLSVKTHHAEFRQLRRLSQIVNRHEQLLNCANPELVEVWDDMPPGLETQASPPVREQSGILDQIVTAFPSDQSALNVFKDEWLSMMPSDRSDLLAGSSPLFEDRTLFQSLADMGGVSGQRVLELGPLEGGHSYMLQNAGAASVVAIESNTRAFLKCLIVKNLFHLDRVEFRCGDFVAFLRQNSGGFDTVIASGVLYHMVNPVELLELISKCTGRVYVWTHYYDEALVAGNPDICFRFQEHRRIRHSGFEHTLHRYHYDPKVDLSKTFAGGLKHYSCWMERAEILACLRHFGFENFHVTWDQPDHPHGPVFAFVATR